MAVTTPAAETVASAVLEDDQTASDVTSCVVPSDIVAVALNWDVGLALTDGAVPVTLRDDTVLGEVVELWQAAENPTNATTIASERVHRTMSASRGLQTLARLVQQACHRSHPPTDAAPSNFLVATGELPR